MQKKSLAENKNSVATKTATKAKVNDIVINKPVAEKAIDVSKVNTITEEDIQTNYEEVDRFNTDTGCDASRIYFKGQEPKQDATQLMCYVKYIYDERIEPTNDNFEKHGKTMIMITDEIQMVKGGIPKYNQKYHGNDENSMKRAWFYIPKNVNDKNSVKLFDTIQKIDDYMVREINEKQNEAGIICALNKQKKRMKLKGLTYKRMITTAKQGNDLTLDDDDNDNKKTTKDFVPWDRIKVKLATQYDPNAGPDDIKDIDTQIFLENKAEPEDTKTVTDIEKLFTWNCTAQFSISFYKLWIDKKGDKNCGFGLKCLQIGITKRSENKQSIPLSKQLHKRLFASPISASANPPRIAQPIKQVQAEEEEEEEESEPEVVPVKTVSKTPVKVAEVKVVGKNVKATATPAPVVTKTEVKKVKKT